MSRKPSTLVDFKPLTESGRMLVKFLESHVKSTVSLHSNGETLAQYGAKVEHIERSYNGKKPVIIIDSYLSTEKAIRFFSDSNLGSECKISLEYVDSNEVSLSETISGALTRIVLKNISDINVSLSIEVTLEND